MNGNIISREYLRMAAARLKAVQILFVEGSYNDVVRECQEVIELILKGALREIGVDPPHTHTMSAAPWQNTPTASPRTGGPA